MAEIDKSLPNVKQTINIPSPEEAQVEIQEKELQEAKDSPIEVLPNEDGSVDVNFDPNVGSQEQGEDHFANLAELSKYRVTAPSATA